MMQPRSHERTERVQLGAGFARCEPSRPCVRKERCARYMAAVPRGASMMDASAPYGSGTCHDFLSVEEVRLRAKTAAAEPRAPHPPLQGAVRVRWARSSLAT